MKKRPWIWLIIANALFMMGIATLVTIAIRHRPSEVPIGHGR